MVRLVEPNTIFLQILLIRITADIMRVSRQTVGRLIPAATALVNSASWSLCLL
jgi:hypothetical protein